MPLVLLLGHHSELPWECQTTFLRMCLPEMQAGLDGPTPSRGGSVLKSTVLLHVGPLILGCQVPSHPQPQVLVFKVKPPVHTVLLSFSQLFPNLYLLVLPRGLSAVSFMQCPELLPISGGYMFITIQMWLWFYHCLNIDYCYLFPLPKMKIKGCDIHLVE